MPEVHGVDKSLILHVKPGHQKSVVTPPTCQTEPKHHTQTTDKGQPTNIVPPVPKPRIGQGRPGIRRKPKVALPTQKPIQTTSPHIPIPVPRVV